MSKPLKFLIGLAVALGAGWVAHGPLGQGEAFLTKAEAQIPPILADIEMNAISGQMQREPMARVAIMSGPADCFQRNGMGSYGGIDARVRTIPGVARVEWANPPPEGECR